MNKVRILFLGASRLVGLLESFHQSGRESGLVVECYSFEDDRPWHAIKVAGVAETIAAPKFDSPEFRNFLIEFIKKYEINIVIPCIDRATVVLAQYAEDIHSAGALAVVSSVKVCTAMANKSLSHDYFMERGVVVPPTDMFPVIAKPRFGASSRGLIVFETPEEFTDWKKYHDVDDYMVQAFIKGEEYSVDAYIARGGEVIGMVSRVRDVVSGGEVMITHTKHNERVLSAARQVFQDGVWFGPQTVQVIDDGTTAYVIECNPRFGSGVPCSIEAGLAIPAYILQEWSRQPLPPIPIEWEDGLCMTRARKDYFLWLS